MQRRSIICVLENMLLYLTRSISLPPLLFLGPLRFFEPFGGVGRKMWSFLCWFLRCFLEPTGLLGTLSYKDTSLSLPSISSIMFWSWLPSPELYLKMGIYKGWVCTDLHSTIVNPILGPEGGYKSPYW